MKDDKQNIEIYSDEPKLESMVDELEQANTDTSFYLTRLRHAHNWWRSIWPGQTVDGRKHRQYIGEEAFPWEGAADARLRVVGTLVKDHVTISKMAFRRGKIQVRSMRPLQEARQSAIGTKLLNWRVYNHMALDVQRELPLAWAWRFAYGVSFLSVEWDQQRRVERHEISLPILAEIMNARGAGTDAILYLMDAIADPAQEDSLTTAVQSMSAILSRPKARAIVKDLRDLHVAQIPVAYPVSNRPRWTALRPCIDITFPSETSDLQEARWVARREWVSETILQDRIETEDYDPGFVEEAKKQKGKSYLVNETADHGYNILGSSAPQGSFRDLVELYHFYYKAIDEYDVPCLYKAVFNAFCCRDKAGRLCYATHGPAEYEHGQYPFVVMRRQYEDRKILSSIGLAEEAYTDEQAIKAQQDGLTDRTSIVHSPPMIVPQNKVAAMKGQRMPGAILGVSRPKEVEWMPLPPTDGTPIEVIQMVQERLDRRYALWGMEGSLDPQLKSARQQEVADDILSEMELALEQTFQLMQQYEVDAEVARVVGANLARPFHMNREDIQGKYEISATIDVRMLDEEYAKEKLGLIGQAMQFNQAGTANMSALFRMAMEVIEPDAADIGLVMDDQAATQKEQADELNAVNQIMSGIEPPLPMYGNHQLRAQTLVQATFQSPNPMMAQRLQLMKDSAAMLQKRLEFFQNQIQQYQQNPQIGRALSTQTFQPKMAPALTMAGQGT